MTVDNVAKYTVTISYTFDVASEREFYHYGHALEKAWWAWDSLGDNGMGFDWPQKRFTFQSVIIASDVEAFSLVRRASRELVEATRLGWPRLTVDTNKFSVCFCPWPPVNA